VADDKAEESEDKEALLGEDLVNPFTGLTLRDYLDGREGVYKALMGRAFGGEEGDDAGGYGAARRAELDRMIRRGVAQPPAR
jgi:hypothetical protein